MERDVTQQKKAWGGESSERWEDLSTAEAQKAVRPQA